jgi:mannose-6-phosphate isomerase-like protein (cupin superfamily)
MLDTDVMAEVFKLRGPLLSQGRMDTVLSETELMQVRLKVYAEGGENTLHTHTSEDHSFIVLQGRARFYDKDGQQTVLARNEGIMLPRGAYYWFHAEEGEPLVMIRVAAKGERKPVARLGADGRPLPGESKENKHVTPVVIPGAFYE